MSGSIVKLNIGGTVFQTSKSTLTKFDGFFKTIFETNVPVTKDSSDCIFIDRSAKHFEKILDYMRDGEVDLPESPEDVKKIRKEARFYLLDGLVEKCKPQMVVRHLEEGPKILINAIVECKKRAVIIVSYPSIIFDSDSSRIAHFIGNHSDDFDVYLSKKLGSSYCHVQIYDKETGKLDECHIYQLSKKIKSLYGIEI